MPHPFNERTYTQGTILTLLPIPKGLIIENKDAKSRDAGTNEDQNDSLSFC